MPLHTEGPSGAYNRVWRKNLYSNVGYDDNYTDISFLQQVRTNVNQKKVTVNEAILITGRVTHQLCVVIIFVVIYLVLIGNLFPPQTIFVYTSLATFLGYLFYVNELTNFEIANLLSVHGKTVVIFLFLGYILSPVLKTLTDSISTDTIYATTVVMMIIHLIFFDYRVKVAIVSNALSTNAAIFSSLCLASRLPTSEQAFVLLTISAECFVLYPSLICAIQKDLALHFLFAFVCITSLFLTLVSPFIASLFLVFVFCLNVMCPMMYVRSQKYKNNIYGPWDEAVIGKES